MSEIDDFLTSTVSQSKSSLENVDDNGVRTIAELATSVKKTTAQILNLENQLKKEKENLRQLTDEDLPDMLFSLGVQSFKLHDGSEVTVKQTYGAHINLENKDAAHHWLRENGYGDLIKNHITCEFGRGEDEAASKFIEVANTLAKIAPKQKTDIHSSTLKAFVKESLQAGVDIPTDLFGVFTGNRATIKQGK